MSMLVSVITPTYNRSDVLPRAIESVKNQSYNNVEHIIIDDGSKDETESVVHSYNIDNIIYKKTESNRGVSAARNEGIKISNGDLICFLDSDDELHTTAVSKMVKVIRDEPERCAGVFGYNKIHNNSNVTNIKRFATGQHQFSDLRNGNTIGGFCGKMIKKTVFEDVGEIDESLPCSEDYDYFLRITKKEYYLLGIDDVITNIHSGNNQITKNANAVIEGQKRIIKKHNDEISNYHLSERISVIAHEYAEAGEIKKANNHFEKCFLSSPYKLVCLYYFIFTLFGSYGYETAKIISNYRGVFTQADR